MHINDVSIGELLGEVFEMAGVVGARRTQTKKLGQEKKIFFSYSKEDREMLDQLLVFLYPLRRSGKLETWDDAKLLPGEDWDEGIKNQLNQADIILLLISANALATDYIQDTEIRIAIERHNRNDARVVPIILRPCSWESSTFSQLNVQPTKGKPVTKWPDQDEAWLNVVDGIERVIDDLDKSQK
ncbi:MAG: toll/interleukin-1 receptor domain-containing protein [Saprospiraceae bacterium]|nr:toll/interleukin-1 receptor domain-containing protein [Saprospiraceae bacterium]